MWLRRKCYFTHPLIIILLWPNITCNHPAYTIQIQEKVNVQKGLCVVVPCKFTAYKNNTFGSNAIGCWLPYHKMDYYTCKDVEHRRHNFKLSGKISEGDCSLTINDANKNDTGTYNFRFEEKELYSYRSRLLKVYVTELTTKPVIVPIKTMIAGEEVTLTCTAPGRCAGTAPTIIWEGSISNITHKTNEEKQLDGNITVSSKIQLTPYKSDHQASLTCKVTYKSAGAPISSNTIILNVEYSLSMEIKITESNSAIMENETVIVKEGDSLILRCAVDSNPAANIIWMKKDNYIKSIMNEKSLALELFKISFSDAA
ncbi:sialic acid-binding Ig-like lectin 14, partial [Discoglossus pictus]